MTEKETCIICLDNEAQILTICCRHPYCFDCLTLTLESKNTCPTCRKTIQHKSDLHPERDQKIPARYLDPANLGALEAYLSRRLINQVSEVWRYRPYAIPKGEPEGYLMAELAMSNKTPLTDQLLYEYERVKHAIISIMKMKLSLRAKPVHDLYVVKLHLTVRPVTGHVEGPENYEINIHVVVSFTETPPPQ